MFGKLKELIGRNCPSDNQVNPQVNHRLLQNLGFVSQVGRFPLVKQVSFVPLIHDTQVSETHVFRYVPLCPWNNPKPFADVGSSAVQLQPFQEMVCFCRFHKRAPSMFDESLLQVFWVSLFVSWAILHNTRCSKFGNILFSKRHKNVIGPHPLDAFHRSEGFKKNTRFFSLFKTFSTVLRQGSFKLVLFWRIF